MNLSEKRILAPTLVLAALLIGFTGLVSAWNGKSPVAAAEENYPPETLVLTEAEQQTFRFFQEGRAAAGAGRGLFETDFFKAKPVPVKEKPPAPTRRDAVLFYRGLAVFPDGARVAYLTIDGRSVTLDPGSAVLDGWALEEFDGDRAILKKGAESLPLPFNRRALVSVPIKP